MKPFLHSLGSRLTSFLIIGIYAYFFLIILAEVVLRYGFGASTPWGEMTARYAFVYLTYIAAAEAIRHGRHIRIDIVPKNLPPRFEKWLTLYIDLLTLLLAGVVVYYSLQLMDIQLTVGIVMPAADLNIGIRSGCPAARMGPDGDPHCPELARSLARERSADNTVYRELGATPWKPISV